MSAAPSETARLSQARANPEQVPRALRALLRDALSSRIGIALDIADNPSAAPKDRLDALNLLARYGLGFPQGGATEGEMRGVLGVVILPALAQSSHDPAGLGTLDPVQRVSASTPSGAARRRDAMLGALRGARAESGESANEGASDGARALGRPSPEPLVACGPVETSGPEHTPAQCEPEPETPSPLIPSPDMVGGARAPVSAGPERVAGEGGGGPPTTPTDPALSGDHPVRTPPYPHTPDSPRASLVVRDLGQCGPSLGELPARATGKGGRGDHGGYGSHKAAEKWVEE